MAWTQQVTWIHRKQINEYIVNKLGVSLKLFGFLLFTPFVRTAAEKWQFCIFFTWHKNLFYATSANNWWNDIFDDIRNAAKIISAKVHFFNCKHYWIEIGSKQTKSIISKSQGQQSEFVKKSFVKIWFANSKFSLLWFF